MVLVKDAFKKATSFTMIPKTVRHRWLVPCKEFIEEEGR